MSIHVHIDRVVVDGIDLSPSDAELLRDAIRTELGGLLAESPATVGDIGAIPARDSRHAGEVRLGIAMTPGRLGADVARAIHEGMHHA